MSTINTYTFNEIRIGHSESFSRVITQDMEDMFREISGDINPLHQDDAYAIDISAGKYGSHVAFGMLTASLLSTLAGVYLPGKYSLIHSVEIGFSKPVFAGDELTVTGEVFDKQDGLNMIRVKVKIINQNNKTVSKGEMKIIVMK